MEVSNSSRKHIPTHGCCPRMEGGSFSVVREWMHVARVIESVMQAEGTKKM